MPSKDSMTIKNQKTDLSPVIVEKTYAGILGKIIGVYLGRAVEGWQYSDILEVFGEINYFVNEQVKQPLIVPDDDISGTFIFFRALEDNGFPANISSESIGKTWLNYIIEDKTILWWGGLGRSTEHTAFLRLKEGVPAPASGSIALNGKAMAEQIGAEIFIDTWAMVNPGDPERAVTMAREAASVSHDGIAVEAACNLASIQAAAFFESKIDTLLDIGYSFIKNDELKRTINDLRNKCCKVGDDWRIVRIWLEENYSYDRFPGNCPMIPNHLILLASLILGGDDFQKALKIAVSSGWDTDCNAGNLGALNGIRLGLRSIDSGPDFRGPIADRIYVVGADGGECISDSVIETRRVLKATANLSGKIYTEPKNRFSFEFPGSVQGFQLCPLHNGQQAIIKIENLNQKKNSNGLGIFYSALAPGVKGSVSVQTFIEPKPGREDDTSYFEVIASPSLYSTQKVNALIYGFEGKNPTISFFIYYFDESEKLSRLSGPKSEIVKGDNNISWQIPDTKGHPIHRIGIELSSMSRITGSIGLLNLDWKGAPENLNFGTSRDLTPNLTPWNTNTFWTRSFVSSAKHFATDFYFTFALSHPTKEGVITTGTRDWINYEVSSKLILELHDLVGLVVRVRGHKRYYAGVVHKGKASIIKRCDERFEILNSVPYFIEPNQALDFKVSVKKDLISLHLDNSFIIEASDKDFVSGGAGFIIETGTVPALGFSVKKIN